MTTAYALIMAGGSGTRLWPLSRKDRPKPLLPLVDEHRTMFQIAVERLYPLFSPDRILVVASEGLTRELRQQAPDLPTENFIVEPIGRDTAPAVGLGAIHVRHRDPQAVMAVLTADHYIIDTSMFRRVLAVAIEMAAAGNIATLGITPTFANTGFGYIERGDLMRTVDGIHVYELKRFTEKPDRTTAEAFVDSGRYTWNSGMFVWPVKRVMGEFQRCAHDLHEGLEAVAGTVGTSGYQAKLGAIWPGMRRVSVDFALMEHIQDNVCVIPVEMGWSDIGNFQALYDVLSGEQGEDNVVIGPAAMLLESQGTLVHSQRMVAAIGVADLVIVDTGDVVLVCRRDRAQEVKRIVESLQENGQDGYL
jgi:mannose-1-phosphate guanylyltransferase